MMARIAQFERDLFNERVKSGLAAARTRGKKLGRQPGPSGQIRQAHTEGPSGCQRGAKLPLVRS